MLIGCAESPDEQRSRYFEAMHQLDLERAQSMQVDLNQSRLDQSCLSEGKTQIRGKATPSDVEVLSAYVRGRWPREPIARIEVTSGVAMVKTAYGCSLLGKGNRIYFEPSGAGPNRSWRLTLIDPWIE